MDGFADSEAIWVAGGGQVNGECDPDDGREEACCADGGREHVEEPDARMGLFSQ